MTVLRDFVDLQDNNHLYHAGDEFPRSGANVNDERMAELSSNKNALGVPLIGKKARRGRKRNAD